MVQLDTKLRVAEKQQLKGCLKSGTAVEENILKRSVHNIFEALLQLLYIQLTVLHFYYTDNCFCIAVCYSKQT